MALAKQFTALTLTCLLHASSALALDASSHLNDPTRPASQSEPGPSGLKLEMIFSQGTQRTAIIAGKAYQAGDKLYGYEIKEITGEQVILRNRSDNLTLRLFSKS